MKYQYFFALLLVTSPICLSAQEKIDWKLLSKVRFKTDYIKDLGAYYLKPKFSKDVLAYECKEVTLKGYFIPVNEQKGFYILSKNPLASCFFCGAAGPETVVELQLKQIGSRRFRVDEILTFKGELALNINDLDHCNYILKNAEPYEP